MTRAVLFKPHTGSSGFKSQIWTPPDDLSVGDAQYFVDDPTRRVQLRPVLKHEQRPGRLFGPSDRWLVYRGEPPLRAFVKMKPGYRDNTPRNVEYAIRQVEKFMIELGEYFRRGLTCDRLEDLASFFEQGGS